VNPIKRRTQQYDYDAYQRVGRENAAGKQDKAAVGERCFLNSCLFQGHFFVCKMQVSFAGNVYYVVV